MHRDDLIYLGSRVLLYGGVLGLGIAAGIQFAFTLVQNAVMTTHAIPLETQAPKVYPVLLLLQDAINYGGGVAAGMLIAGGSLARRRMLTEWLTEADEA